MEPRRLLTQENLLSIRELRQWVHHKKKKKAYLIFFYSGEYGMGTMANELSLGCDCLGQIHYLVRAVILASSIYLWKKLKLTTTTARFFYRT